MIIVQTHHVQGERGPLECYWSFSGSRNCAAPSACDLLGLVNDSLKSFPLSHCAAGVPHRDAECWDALYRALIKGHQQSLNDVMSPEHSQEVRSLLGLFSSSHVFMLQLRSCLMWTPRKQKFSTFSTPFPLMIKGRASCFVRKRWDKKTQDSKRTKRVNGSKRRCNIGQRTQVAKANQKM